MKIETQS